MLCSHRKSPSGSEELDKTLLGYRSARSRIGLCLEPEMPRLGSARSHISFGITYLAMPGATPRSESHIGLCPAPHIRSKTHMWLSRIRIFGSNKLLWHSRSRKSYSGIPGSTSIQVSLGTTIRSRGNGYRYRLNCLFLFFN